MHMSILGFPENRFPGKFAGEIIKYSVQIILGFRGKFSGKIRSFLVLIYIPFLFTFMERVL